MSNQFATWRWLRFSWVFFTLYGACGGAAMAAADGWVEFLGLRAPVPATWRPEPPESSMRLAQFAVPGPDGRGGAQVVFYFFGAGQGGTPEANIARWQSQFRDPEGAAVQPAVQGLTVAGMAVTLARLQGSYARGVGVGPQGDGKADQTLLAAIVQTPRGQLTIQLHGDSPVVAATAADFEAMVHGMVPGPAD